MSLLLGNVYHKCYRSYFIYSLPNSVFSLTLLAIDRHPLILMALFALIIYRQLQFPITMFQWRFKIDSNLVLYN